MDNLIGQRLDGRYQIDQLIGEGGMADVYRGVDLLENRVVAVKVLKDEYRSNPELVRRFKNESRAISVLNHQNIVKVYDVSVSDKLQYIVMEFLDGITLKEYIEQRGEPLTYKEVVHFTALVLQALQHAHAKGIVHRDIKPQNIMIQENGGIKMMDFGIARLARSEIHTAGEQAIGSVHYISPEQAQGADTDMRADIYSVGIMMYEMLSGKLPFEDENAVSVAIKQISDTATPLREVNPSIPQGLADITMKAMAKNPADRYRDALDMLRDIEEFKRDPSIKFDYEYMGNGLPAKGLGRIMSNGKQPAPKTPPQKPGKRRLRRKKRIGLLVPITLGITLAVLGVSLVMTSDLVKNSSNPLFGTYEDIALPDFVNEQYSYFLDVYKQDTYKHLRVKVEEKYNPDVEAGIIMAQNPSSSNDNPKQVKANQQLTLTVSSGIQMITVPETAGMTRAEAIQAIQAAGLMPYAKAEYGSNVPAGKVIGTEPEAGITVANVSGTVITIRVSSTRASYERTVPDVVGLSSLEAAQGVLESMDLMIGVVKEVDSDAAPGTILEQSPARGTVVSVASDVHLTIAKEPPPPEPDPEPEVESGKVSVPGVVGSSEGAAVAAITGAGFSVDLSYKESSKDPGTVIDQSPDGGSMKKPGSTVKIVVAKAKEPDSSSEPPPPPSSSEPPPSSSEPPPPVSSEIPVSSLPPPDPAEPGGETGEQTG
ncbi:MAG: Stk1 family PASTA domain-containing Ser/Thr kinase [Ruminococcaceae bacterium]|nr:Stk1 family PASTA domain-containing Ser/Thr kinase [Oscillospiraceae bacterium]